jgi:hypothetical protein
LCTKTSHRRPSHTIHPMQIQLVTDETFSQRCNTLYGYGVSLKEVQGALGKRILCLLTFRTFLATFHIKPNPSTHCVCTTFLAVLPYLPTYYIRTSVKFSLSSTKSATVVKSLCMCDSASDKSSALDRDAFIQCYVHLFPARGCRDVLRQNAPAPSDKLRIMMLRFYRP